MVAAIIFFLILISMPFAASFYLYCFAFYYPPKARKHTQIIPDSPLYTGRKEELQAVIDEMEHRPYEKVFIQSYDGYQLCGRVYVGNPKAPFILFFHGYHGNAKWDGYGVFCLSRDYGYNLLMVDERAHGFSGSNTITMGIRERYDCRKWVEYILERYGHDTRIVLSGVSMGAATVLMACSLGLPANVKAVIADCGYTAPMDILKSIAHRMKLPVESGYWLAKLGARLYGHYDLEEASAIESVRKSHIPTLFIHGSEDSVVPVDMCRKLYDACAAIKEKVIVQGADHAVNAVTDYAVYEKNVMEFLTRFHCEYPQEF